MTVFFSCCFFAKVIVFFSEKLWMVLLTFDLFVFVSKFYSVCVSFWVVFLICFCFCVCLFVDVGGVVLANNGNRSTWHPSHCITSSSRSLLQYICTFIYSYIFIFTHMCIYIDIETAAPLCHFLQISLNTKPIDISALAFTYSYIYIYQHMHILFYA